MKVIIGIIFVIVCVIGGYLMVGGHLHVLWQPAEVVIIVGSAIGAFVISNSSHTLSAIPGAFGVIFGGGKIAKPQYIEVLCMQYTVFKLAKTKGMLELESHIENPKESSIFKNFPGFLHHHEALDFFCDYMRMLTMGTDNPHQMEDLMNEEIEIHHHHQGSAVTAIQNMADGMPALGIVAAVLGVIHTMGAISEPPEVLGHLIGGALVGTFLGVLMSYGFIGPLGGALKGIYDSEVKYLYCIKAGILAYLNGYAPAIAIEFARKAIEPDHRPSFLELEQAISNLSSS